jgi:excisionase family DNA binding protein
MIKPSPTADMQKKFVTSKQLSEIISVPVWTIQKLTRERKITAYSFGRRLLFDVEEVCSQIKKYRVN